MKKSSSIVYILSILLGLIAMCLCSIVISPKWSGFAGYLVFICMAGVIIFTASKEHDSPRAKTFSACIILGLIGIAVMQFCGLILPVFISGLAAFIVFLVFAAVILVILKNQKPVLDAEYMYLAENHQKQDAVSFIISTLRAKGVADDEIRDTLVNQCGIDAQMVDSLLSAK